MPAILSRADAEALVRRALGFSTADATRVNVTSGWTGNTRFAGGEITTAGGTTDTTVTITATVGKKRAAASTNVLDNAALKRTVDLAQRLAQLSPDDPDYPKRLCELELPPALEITGALDGAARVVAIVGSRAGTEQACAFAYGLAYHWAKAGIVVSSGGALGIDSCAHSGAMAGGGATWAVACTWRGRVYPP